jgi:hypothetical protein
MKAAQDGPLHRAAGTTEDQWLIAEVQVADALEWQFHRLARRPDASLRGSKTTLSTKYHYRTPFELFHV